jgi:four helix bundle protein
MPKEYDIKDRTFRFAQIISEIVSVLPKISECGIIRKQLTKAGTSIRENAQETGGALTKKDSVNKMGIARKEAKESRYWLRLISGRYIDEDKVASDIQEAGEIKNILSSIIDNTKKTK